jgi:hypothetical protein
MIHLSKKKNLSPPQRDHVMRDLCQYRRIAFPLASVRNVPRESATGIQASEPVSHGSPHLHGVAI